MLQRSGIEDIYSRFSAAGGIEKRDPLRVVARQSTLRYVCAKAEISIDSWSRKPDGTPAGVDLIRIGGQVSYVGLRSFRSFNTIQ